MAEGVHLELAQSMGCSLYPCASCVSLLAGRQRNQMDFKVSPDNELMAGNLKARTGLPDGDGALRSMESALWPRLSFSSCRS